MQGLLLVLFVNYASYASSTLLLGSQQRLVQAPVDDFSRGVIRLGQICESSLECRSGCCLYNKTARVFTCQRENQRYSNCAPRRPKILWGSFLDVYLHHCPCKPHLRCVREHTWHVCEKRKPPHVIPKPQGQKPIDEGRPPQQKPPAKPPVKPSRRPPHWSPGVGTYNGTLGLGAPCATSIDCKSECCMYNPRVGFSYCHRQEQIYDDCTPWHPNEERGTLVDVYFRHCPCSRNLRCTKEKKLHICRKKELEFGTDPPSQQQPVQEPNVQTPQLDSEKPLQQRPVQETAVGVPETHPAKPEYTGQIPLSPGPTQQQQIEKPELQQQKPLSPPPHPPPSRRPGVGKPRTHAGKSESEQQQQIQNPLFEEQKPLPRPPLLKPEARNPGSRRRKPGRKTQKPRPLGSAEQQRIQTPTPGEQTQLPTPSLQKPDRRQPRGRRRKPSKKPSTQELVETQQRQTPMPGTQNPLPTQTSQTAPTAEAEEQVPTQKPLQQKPSQKPMKQKQRKNKKKRRNSSEEDR